MGRGLPPEVLLLWEVVGIAEVSCLDDIVVATSALHPSPEEVTFELVLVAQLEHARLQGNDLFCRESLADTIGKLELGR